MTRAALLVCLACLLGAAPAWAAPAWLAPTNLSAPGRDATNARVAMDGAGETVAIWERQSETEVAPDVQASIRSPGEAFSTPVELSKMATDPDVAMTPSGEAVALWRHFDLNDEGNYVIQASFRPPGGRFSAPLDVAVTPTAALPQELRVVVNDAGDTAVVWSQQEPDSGLSPNPTVIEASIRPAGGDFSTPAVISPSPPIAEQSAQSPRIAIDAAGDVAAAWQYNDGTDEVIQSAARPAAGDFSAPENLTADGEEAFEPDIAMDSSGATTVLWDRLKESEYTVQESSSPLGGPFTAPVNLSAADPAPPGSPALAIGASGAATAAWTQSDGTSNLVQAATRPSGGAFSPPANLSAVGEESLYPEVAMNGAGAATVVWKGSDASNDIIQASTGSAGTFSAPVNLSAGGQDALFPTVAMDSAGDATALWWRSDGANEIVQAAGYDAGAPVLRGLSIPSSGTVGVPVAFSASPFDFWPIAASAFSFGDGASAAGTSVSHIYSAPGTYQVTVNSTGAAGTAVSGGAPIKILASNEFKIGKLSLNRKKGTGAYAITVPGPGSLVLSGKGVKRASVHAKRAATVKLALRSRGKALARLSKRGRVRVAVVIAFTPEGAAALAKKKDATLVKKISAGRPRRSPHHA